jgi:hypothetical protein
MSKNNNMKISELKKHLKELDHNELIKVITDLYKLNGGVKDFLNVKFSGNDVIKQLFDRAYEEIKHEFFPEKGFGKMRLAKAKKAISDYKKLTGDNIGAMDLMLSYVEFGTAFTDAYGDIDERFYDSMESAYDKVVTACEKEETLFKQFRERLYHIIIETDGIGWGYHDNLKDIYYSIGWLEEE